MRETEDPWLPGVGAGGRDEQLHPRPRMPHSEGDVDNEEGSSVWEWGYMGNLCTPSP